jgi:hypothetical protein
MLTGVRAMIDFLATALKAQVWRIVSAPTC